MLVLMNHRVTRLGLAVLVAISGCGSREATNSTSAARPVGGTPVLLAVAPAGIPALVAPRGGVTLVNVWATWCAPCRREFPGLLGVASERASQGVRLVLISADFPDQRPAVLSFLAAQGIRDTTYIKDGPDQPFIDSLSPRWSGPSLM